MASFNAFQMDMEPLSRQYRCYSVSMLLGNDRKDVERGGKIIMPPSALGHLTRLDITFPMLFKLTNRKNNRVTHCGVLEFVANEGTIYLPHWMMKLLLLMEGSMVHIENVTLEVATFAKLQPHSDNFLLVTNPKAVLENALKNFACLSTGDVVDIECIDTICQFCVLETKPGKAVCITDCSINVVIIPVDERPSAKSLHSKNESNLIITVQFVALNSKGGKESSKKTTGNMTGILQATNGIPNYEIGTLTTVNAENGNANKESENAKNENDIDALDEVSGKTAKKQRME